MFGRFRCLSLIACDVVLFMNCLRSGSKDAGCAVVSKRYLVCLSDVYLITLLLLLLGFLFLFNLVIESNLYQWRETKELVFEWIMSPCRDRISSLSALQFFLEYFLSQIRQL